MKFRKLLIYVGLLLVVVEGCKKNDASNNNGSNGSTGSTGTTSQPYTITEDFESGSKTGYADGNVNLITGTWDFNNALIGNLAADVKDGAWSVRLKTGDIAMNFDINGITQISIKHAKYGTDPASAWQLLQSTDGGVTYTQLGSTINETSTTLVTDSFKVTVTGKVRFEIKKTDASTSSRINLDDITFKGNGDPGIVVGPPDTGGPDTTNTTSATTPRGVTVGADAPPATGDNSNLLMGNPSGAQASMTLTTNYLIDQGYYAESYSSVKSEPNWVSWHLDASNITSSTGRSNNFAAFNGLPSGWYTVQSNSYVGSGFDRGHNCPSGDRTSSVDANSATFLMTNMIPQAPQNNQQTWEKLESYLREQVVAGYEVYIIMGSYGTGGVGSASTATVNTINNGKVNVPSNVWKVAVILPKGDNDLSRVTASTRVIAVNTPNINSINTDWTKYIVSVRDIETVTGYNLLSNLPQNIQDAIEVKKDAGQ